METEPIRYSLEENDVVMAMRRVMVRRMVTGPRRWALVAYPVLLGCLAGLTAWSGQSQAVVVALLLAPPIAFAMIWYWIAPQMARRHFRQSAALRDESAVSWDADAVTFDSPRGTIRFPFADYHGFDETDRLVILYQSEMLYNAVPQRALGAKRQGLIACLVSAGVPRM